jgi:hypothetical protein
MEKKSYSKHKKGRIVSADGPRRTMISEAFTIKVEWQLGL